MEELKKHNKGIIALSACLAGDVRALMNRNYEKAKQFALDYRHIWRRNFWRFKITIAWAKVNSGLLVKLSKETGIPLVATNDVHYVNKEDSKKHDVLMCILQMGKTLNDPNRMRFGSDEFYLKSRNGRIISICIRGYWQYCENSWYV